MVHGQVFAPHRAVAVMANPLLSSAVPPVGTSQTPGLFLFPSYLFIAKSLEIDSHIKPDGPEKVTDLSLSFPRTRESRGSITPLRDWTPAFAGVTALKTFYETINP